jgi:cytochrome P450
MMSKEPPMIPPFLDVDLASARFKADPHPTFARLRETMPVARVKVRGPAGGGENTFVVSRYSDVSALLKDRRFAKDPANAGQPALRAPQFLRPLMRNMLGLDDPDHARLKKLVQAAFTPRRIEQMRQRTEAISHGLLDRLSRKRDFDLIADYAMPLPVTVISELLGVPAADQDRFARWSGALIRAGSSQLAIVPALPQIVLFLRYLKRLIEMKRATPADDLVSALVAAEAEGDRLDGDELMAMIGILLSAGHETTVNLIGNGMLALLDHPEAYAHVRATPELMGTAVEEVLRFASPIAASTHRFAREDVLIADTLIPRGALVFGLIASANRDEHQFSRADHLDLARSPNRHLTFGEGGHYCVGAALARMEGAVAFRHLMERFPALRLSASRNSLRWNPNMTLSGLRSLPVAA